MSLKLPLLPLRDVVVYPQMVVPLFVGREKSIRALDAAINVRQVKLVGNLLAHGSVVAVHNRLSLQLCWAR